MKQFNLICILLTVFSLRIWSQPPVQGNVSDIGIVEKLGDTLPADIKLANQNGDSVLLGDIVNKPTVISFVYYRCPGLCSPLMDGIADVIDKMDMKMGDEYQVLTISFDTREKTELAAGKRRNYLKEVKSPGADKGWIFMTGDSSNIARITSAAGFGFQRTGNNFIHNAGLIVVSPERKITRYLNGTYFLPFELKLALIEASKGIPGPTINKVLQFCYSYDPQGQRYALNITRVSGVIITFFMLCFFLYLVLKPLFRKRAKSSL